VAVGGRVVVAVMVDCDRVVAAPWWIVVGFGRGLGGWQRGAAGLLGVWRYRGAAGGDSGGVGFGRVASGPGSFLGHGSWGSVAAVVTGSGTMWGGVGWGLGMSVNKWALDDLWSSGRDSRMPGGWLVGE